MRLLSFHIYLGLVMGLQWFVAGPAVGAQPTHAPTIIPKPALMKVKRGTFTLAPGTKIFLLSDDPGARWAGEGVVLKTAFAASARHRQTR